MADTTLAASDTADVEDDGTDTPKPSQLINGNVPQHNVTAQDSGAEDSLEEDTEGGNGSGLSGEESDVEDNANDTVTFPSMHVHREANPTLPDTVTRLYTPEGSLVYVVGTAHFSHSSQEDVAQTIDAAKPDYVMVELCHSRVNILQLDEARLLEEAKNMDFSKVRTVIKQNGLIQGVMHLLLLNMSAHLTEQLGMAPGGEFRRAFKEAQKIPGCRVQLGDRPISVTLRRALGALSLWQKMRLGWYMLTSKEPISKEDVEKCKQKDLLEEMLREMTGEFPALSQVFVSERDLFLAHSLRIAAKPIPIPGRGLLPVVVVGVVGIGHVPGIVANWDQEVDLRELMKVPEGTFAGSVVRWTIRASLVGLLSWGCYKAGRATSRFFS